MGRLLATLATLLILVLAAAFAVPEIVDWNQYRPLIERTASSLTGRKVSILGDIDIVLLPEPHLRANNVAAGNPVTDSAALTADSVDLLLSLQALLAGRIEAGSIRLVRPVLTLDFAKPFKAQDTEDGEEALPLSAGANSIEIDRGRLSVFSKDNSTTEALSLTKIGGTVTVGTAGIGYRFGGRFLLDGRQYEAKLAAVPAPGGSIRLTGGATDTSSKISLQADGQLTGDGDPLFQGTLSGQLPPQTAGANRIPVESQFKANTKVSLSAIMLDDLEITLDPQNRPQVLLGSASFDYASKTLNLSLLARAIDADGLMAANPVTGIPVSAPLPADWGGLNDAMDRLLWINPDVTVRLSLEAGQAQFRGEPVEELKISGSRTPERWVFDHVHARLPGDTELKLAGTVSNERDGHLLNATASIEGKYLSRLGRWIAASDFKPGQISTGLFAAQGAVMLSAEAAAFEGVTGTLDGTHFSGSVRLDKAPARKLTFSLSGDDFDLSRFGGGNGDALRGGLTRLATLFDASAYGFQSVEADIAAAGVKTGATALKNVAAHIKSTGGGIDISRLSAETDAGLAVEGRGRIPSAGSGEGRFEGRLEAKSSEAVLQLAVLAGPGEDSILGRRAGALAPASLAVSYGTEPDVGTAAATLSGTLGTMRAEGRARLTGPLKDWRSGQFSAELSLSAADGNALPALIAPGLVIAPGASLAQGSLNVQLVSAAGQVKTSASLNSPALQAQLEGVTSLQGAAPVFKGTVQAASQTPEQFLPAPVLALVGGEARAALRLDASAELAPAYANLSGLSAESPNNTVTGSLSIDRRGKGIHVETALKADAYSLPMLMSYFLAGSAADQDVPALPATVGAPAPPPDLWSGRPFSLPAFEETSGTVALEAKIMKLSDSIALSGGRLHAEMEDGVLGIEELKGKTLGGDLKSSFSLAAKGTTVVGEGRVALSGADLALLAAPGTTPMIASRAWLSLAGGGEGLSPRGLIAVLRGRGSLRLSGGLVSKLSPSAVQKSAEDLLAGQGALTEETVAKKVRDSVPLGDFGFRLLRAPLLLQDGVLEIPRASLRGRDITIRLEALLDLGKMQVDSTWEMGVNSSGRVRWPPLKVTVSGPVRELGSSPRMLAADEFVRAIIVRKLEGDLTRLEGLNRPAALPWSATQEPVPKPSRRRRRENAADDQQAAGGAQPEAAAPAGAPSPFEKRLRDALDNPQASAPPN